MSPLAPPPPPIVKEGPWVRLVRRLYFAGPGPPEARFPASPGFRSSFFPREKPFCSPPQLSPDSLSPVYSPGPGPPVSPTRCRRPEGRVPIVYAGPREFSSDLPRSCPTK